MRTLIVLFFTATTFLASAETTLKNVNTKPKAGLQLKIQGEDGTNGSAVAWHPGNKMYYTIIAGNTDYPMEVFNENGRNLQSSKPNVDMRGLWYNDEYEILEGNAYESHDVVSFYTDEDGMIVEDEEPVYELYELSVDEPQAVLCYNSEESVYAWYDQANSVLTTLDMENGDVLDDIDLNLKTDDANINYTTVIYTGIKGGEYGLLNFTDKLVYLIDEDNGKVSSTIKLPKEAITSNSFRFSYANGNIWLYDVDQRLWTGYKILK